MVGIMCWAHWVKRGAPGQAIVSKFVTHSSYVLNYFLCICVFVSFHLMYKVK